MNIAPLNVTRVGRQNGHQLLEKVGIGLYLWMFLVGGILELVKVVMGMICLSLL